MRMYNSKKKQNLHTSVQYEQDIFVYPRRSRFAVRVVEYLVIIVGFVNRVRDNLVDDGVLVGIVLEYDDVISVCKKRIT